MEEVRGLSSTFPKTAVTSGWRRGASEQSTPSCRTVRRHAFFWRARSLRLEEMRHSSSKPSTQRQRQTPRHQKRKNPGDSPVACFSRIQGAGQPGVLTPTPAKPLPNSRQRDSFPAPKRWLPCRPGPANFSRAKTVAIQLVIPAFAQSPTAPDWSVPATASN